MGKNKLLRDKELRSLKKRVRRECRWFFYWNVDNFIILVDTIRKLFKRRRRPKGKMQKPIEKSGRTKRGRNHLYLVPPIKK